jgi:hypothetical protein
VRIAEPTLECDIKELIEAAENGAIWKSGSIVADGHNLNLYGAVLVRHDKICTTAEGTRWACGQRVFIALRSLFGGRSITCRFKHVTVQRPQQRNW